MGRKKKKEDRKPLIPSEVKQIICGIGLILASVLIVLAFFGKSGEAGRLFMKSALFLAGSTVFITPAILFLAGLVLVVPRERKEGLTEKTQKLFWPSVIASFTVFLGLTGILGSFDVKTMKGGWIGYLISWPFLSFFGFWAAEIILSAIVLIGAVIFWIYLVPKRKTKEDKKEDDLEEEPEKPSIIKKIFAPRFKVESVPHTEDLKREERPREEKPEKDFLKQGKIFAYNPPPLDLLSLEKGQPNSGDTNLSSAVIKRTFQNFGIEVAMSEVNVGPTVTQYTLKPAEGIKLSKITGLSNDLALSLAAHPIRIEAPIPGRSLVGIEVPNKGRAEVRLRNLIENDGFQKSYMNLSLALGRDVAGNPMYADLAKCPHLLVAGATGTGKTIFLNSLIASLLYQPSTATKSAGPETLRIIMVDPKRVEFPVYNNLPHLLCPVIYNANQTVNALKLLTMEMERRFDVLAHGKSRDIGSFNEKALGQGSDPLPFIVVIIDELADLMMARGRDIEAGIVRLAQMARAVGIHLVVATQRPSVEVITGLIKANITSRITFQVASQIDSRTIIDTSGAEKLLGAGDMLYVSAQTPKPKRIQGAYVSDKEMRRIVKHIEDQSESLGFEMDEGLIEELNKTESPDPASFYGEDSSGEDTLYEEAKKLVIESKKASASLLQRRLRVGYARAARLIDMLEERGVVGSGEGAKPREVYGEVEAETMNYSKEQETPRTTEDGWEKV